MIIFNLIFNHFVRGRIDVGQAGPGFGGAKGQPGEGFDLIVQGGGRAAAAAGTLMPMSVPGRIVRID